jgi:DNA polymerase III epsilon subunit-like protein
MSIIVLDLETTGINVFDAEIITGFFIHADESFNIKSTYEIKCNPINWSDEAEKIHGITRQEAAAFNKFSEVYRGLIDWIDLCQPKQMWMHCNSKTFGKLAYFDHAVLRMNMMNVDDVSYFKICNITPFSTHSLCKIVQGSFNFESFRLDSICKELGIKLKHHDAESDTFACLEIIKQLLPLTTIEAINDYEKDIEHEEFSIINPIKPRQKKRTSRLI